ncbi:MAG: heavy-metal-associated domain-containing protein [Wolinella sp.]
MKKSFEVENVKCGGCANSLKSSLEGEFGVIDVDIDGKKITLDIDDSKIEKLRARLKEIGFPIAGDGGFLGKLKSFISCKLG